MTLVNLDEWMEKLRFIADAAGKKTGEMVEFSKYKLETVRISGEIKRLQEKLGMEVYRLVKTNGSDSDVMNTLTEQIDAQFKRLDEIERAVVEMQNKQLCENCGAVNPKDAVYCLKCGEKLSKEEPFEDCCCKENDCSYETDSCCCADDCDCGEEEKTEE